MVQPAAKRAVTEGRLPQLVGDLELVDGTDLHTSVRTLVDGRALQAGSAHRASVVEVVNDAVEVAVGDIEVDMGVPAGLGVAGWVRGIFVTDLEDIPPGTPVNTIVFVR